MYLHGNEQGVIFIVIKCFITVIKGNNKVITWVITAYILLIYGNINHFVTDDSSIIYCKLEDMHPLWSQLAYCCILACNFVENAEIKTKTMAVERQKKISSTETILSFFPVRSVIHCASACNIDDRCLYGSLDEETDLCYLYSNRNPPIEDHSNSLVFTKCHVARGMVAF